MRIIPAFGFCLETPMRDLVDFECDVTTYPYVTVIHHDREQRTFVVDYEYPVSVSIFLTQWGLEKMITYPCWNLN